MNNTNQIIETIINKVTELNPEIKVTPENDSDISMIKKLCPQVPEMLLALLKQCDGTWATSFFPSSLDLLKCELIIDFCQDEDAEEPIDLEDLQPEDLETLDKAIKPIFFNKKHLVFASCNEDSFLLIDFERLF